MSGDQVLVGLLAATLVSAYFCRMDAFHPRRHNALLGLAHYAGFSAAGWVACAMLQAAPGPLHGVALMVSGLWLFGSYPEAQEAAPSGLRADRAGD